MPTIDPTQVLWAFLSPPQAPGELGRLGQYRVLKQLGSGGMGIVFQAEDVHLHRIVALKVMRPEVSTQDRARARFLREARATAALKHDNVVTIYQVGEDHGVPFLAMEYLSGKSLEDWLRPDRRASVSETIGIGKQIAKGLVAAHAAGLIHRDIKPANLWLEMPKGRMKILDFGLARLTDGEFTALTMDGAAVGTPAFMAPEQARGDVADHRCDLFSFGCVLYRMVTGRLPFQGNTVYAVLAAIASETPPPARVINPNLPPQLDELINKLLAKSPNDRPSSMQAVLDELQVIEKVIKDVPAAVAPAGAPLAVTTEKSRWLGGRRLWGAMAVIVILVVGVIAITAGRHPTTVEPTPIVKDEPTENKTERAPQPAAAVNLAELIDPARDKIQGGWLLTKNDMLLARSTDNSGFYYLSLPWKPPREYRLKFNVARIKDDYGFVPIGLASGAAKFMISIDGWHDGKYHTGLAGAGPAPWTGRIVSSGVPVTLVCTVGKEFLTLEANGRQIFRSPRAVFENAPRANDFPASPLFLGGHNCGLRFSNIVLEPLGESAGESLTGAVRPNP